MYQITAYEILGGLQINCTTSAATETGSAWEHRILELVEVPPALQGDAWDIVWLIGQVLQDRALQRGGGAQREAARGRVD